MKHFINFITISFLFLNSIIAQYKHNIEIEHDLTFRSVDSFLTFDRYYPVNQKMMPTVIILHGGSFQKIIGQKESMTKIAYDLSIEGYQVFNINYLKDDICLDLSRGFWQSAISLDNFLMHISTNSERYKIDLNNVFLLGHSAGAITCLGYYYYDIQEVEGQQYLLLDNYGYFRTSPVKIRGIVSIAGGWTELDHLDGELQTPLMLIHQYQDPVIPCDHGIVFTQFGRKVNGLMGQIKSEISSEIKSITKNLKIDEMGISEHFENDFDKLFLTEIYGGLGIYNYMRSMGKNNCVSNFVEGKGHRLSQLYSGDVKNEIINFLADNKIIETQYSPLEKVNQYYTLHKKNIYLAASLIFGGLLLTFIFKSLVL